MDAARTYIRERVLIEDRGYSSPCWVWQLSLDAYGYAQCCLPGGRVRKVHRLSYETFIGPFPDGLVTDHLCRNRNCVNPAHLEAVTNTENVRRGKAAVKWTHCQKGHPLNGSNLTPKSRSCRICKRQWYERNRTRILAKMAATRENNSRGGSALHGQRPGGFARHIAHDSEATSR